MSKVFIVSMMPKMNFTDAAGFGELVAVYPPDLQVVGGAGVTNHLVEMARDALNGFTEEDFIIPVGDPTLIGIVFAVAAEQSTKLRVLKWDRFERGYVPTEVQF
jgi:hypothetical protein